MIEFTLILGVVTFILWLLYVECQREAAREMQEAAEEFRERFPGRCMICSYERAAARDGSRLKPMAHHCTERKPLNEAVPIDVHNLEKDARPRPLNLTDER